ncbi:MAG: hypothetical protein GY799_26165, partial [Desulfobulbaceae bacterium]|nr:hypothetical protein [Desulfobulbaceae bacterium]
MDNVKWLTHLAYHFEDDAMQEEVLNYIKEKNVTALEPVLDFIYRTMLDEDDCDAVRSQLPNIIWHSQDETLIHFKSRIQEAYKDSRRDRRFRQSDQELLAASFRLGLPEEMRKEMDQHFGTECDCDDIDQLCDYAIEIDRRNKRIRSQEQIRCEMKSDTYKT